MPTISLPDLPSTLILDRDPRDSGAPRSWDVLLLSVDLEDDTATVSTRTMYGGDATPEREWNGRVRTYQLASARNGAQVIDPKHLDDLVGTAQPLVDRISAGGSVYYDGSNHRGRLDDDAQDAEDALTQLVDRCELASDSLSAWAAVEWLYGAGQVQYWIDSVWPSGTSLEAAAAAVVTSALADGALLDDDDVRTVLQEARDEVDAARAESASDDA